MKKKSASQSAFFNLRVLIGLFIVLAGVFLALVGLGTFSALTASSSKRSKGTKSSTSQAFLPGFDCSTIHELGIDKMENFRAGAIMIACGEAKGGCSFPSLGLRPGLSKNCWQSLWHLAPRTLTWSPAPRPLPTLLSRRHSLRLTQITPTRLSSPTTTHEAQRQPDQHLRRIGLHRRRHDLYPPDQRQRSKPLRQYLWRPCCSVQQANRHLVHGLA